MLKLAIQYKNGENVKIEGQIVWTNDDGFGVKFLSVD